MARMESAARKADQGATGRELQANADTAFAIAGGIVVGFICLVIAVMFYVVVLAAAVS